MIYPGKLMMVFCDVHVYDEHMEAVKIQLSREPYLFPQIKLNYDIKTFDMTGHGSIGMMKYDTIKLTDYFSHDSIKAQMIA
jgi:thymidylate synthase